MIEVRNTFLHFLSDNLTTPVNYVVDDPNNQLGRHFKVNAINVTYLNEQPRVGIGKFPVAIDVIFESELDALPVMTTLFNLLTASGMTPLLDYTQSPPAVLGCNVFWDLTKIEFKRLQTDNYFRRSCVLTLYTHIS